MKSTEQGVVTLIHIDRRASERPQLCRPSHMIDVAMGDDNGLHFELVLIEGCGDFGELVAGIDHDGFVRLLIAKNRTVAAELANGKNDVNHGAGFIVTLAKLGIDIRRLY